MAKIYKQVSSSLIISRMYDNFAIDYSDWEQRAIEWIGEALSYMNVTAGLLPVYEDRTVSQYRFTLPCPLKALDAIMYNGYRLERDIAINGTDSNTINDRYHPTESYSLTRNNQVSTTFEEGTVTVYYRKLAVDCNSYPMIPDNEKVINACCWYILRNILARGHVHPVFTWKDANSMWEQEYPRAINSSLSLDSDARELHKQLWSSLLVNPNAWKNSFFDNTAAYYEGSESNTANAWVITFNANVTGFTITVSPDTPVTVDASSNQYKVAREDGIYSYLVTKTGYHDLAGSVGVIAKDVTESINMELL